MAPDISTMAVDLACAPDAPSFPNRAGIIPDPWQIEFLRSGTRQQILLCSRQAGKSTISAVMATHKAIYAACSTVLLLSPSLRQSQELFRKVLDVYRISGQIVPTSVENRLTLELANQSRIVCLPGKEGTVRGYSSVDLLLVDEAGWVSDELYQAVRPMLAVSGGRIVLLSTPNGKRGFFYQEWTHGGTSWHRTIVTAQEVPRIDRDWLREEQSRIPNSVFQSEYMCVFQNSSNSVFMVEDLERAQRKGVEQWVL